MLAGNLQTTLKTMLILILAGPMRIGPDMAECFPNVAEGGLDKLCSARCISEVNVWKGHT